MALEKRTSLYEVFIRFGHGSYDGAHAIDAEEIVEDGRVVSTRKLPARPIVAREFGKLLGAQTARLIAAADAAVADAGEQRIQREAAEEATAVAQRLVEAKDRSLAELVRELDAARKAYSEAAEQVIALRAAFELARAEQAQAST